MSGRRGRGGCVKSLPDAWRFAEEKNRLKRIDLSLDLKEKVERLPSSARLVDDAWIKLLDEPAVVAIGYDEFMNLPIHETREASTSRCDSPYFGSIRSAVGTAISTCKLCIKTFVTFVAEVPGRTTAVRSRNWTYPIIAVIAPKTLVGIDLFAGRAFHGLASLSSFNGQLRHH